MNITILIGDPLSMLHYSTIYITIYATLQYNLCYATIYATIYATSATSFTSTRMQCGYIPSSAQLRDHLPSGK